MLENSQCRNASRALRDAIRSLQLHRAKNAVKPARLRQSIDIGIVALDRAASREIEGRGFGSLARRACRTGSPLALHGVMSASLIASFARKNGKPGAGLTPHG